MQRRVSLRGCIPPVLSQVIFEQFEDQEAFTCKNKAVYAATPVAGGWAGVGAVMIWAGALTSMKYSHLNFSTFKQLKNAKKEKCDGPTDRRTDGPTDTVTFRSRCPRQEGE